MGSPTGARSKQGLLLNRGASGVAGDVAVALKVGVACDVYPLSPVVHMCCFLVVFSEFEDADELKPASLTYVYCPFLFRCFPSCFFDQ